MGRKSNLKTTLYQNPQNYRTAEFLGSTGYTRIQGVLANIGYAPASSLG